MRCPHDEMGAVLSAATVPSGGVGLPRPRPADEHRSLSRLPAQCSSSASHRGPPRTRDYSLETLPLAHSLTLSPSLPLLSAHVADRSYVCIAVAVAWLWFCPEARSSISLGISLGVGLQIPYTVTMKTYPERTVPTGMV